MSPLVFVDASIPIYAAGRAHPLKRPASRILAAVAERPDAFISDVEVIQELMHRYLALRIWDAGRAVVEQFLTLMEGRLEAVRVEDVRTASVLADDHPGIPARDLLHAAVMGRVGAGRIVSADRDFDRIAGVERLDPAKANGWLDSVSE